MLDIVTGRLSVDVGYIDYWVVHCLRYIKANSRFPQGVFHSSALACLKGAF